MVLLYQDKERKEKGMKKEKEIEFDLRKTMTKKQWLEKQKAKRNANGFNTGTRDMKSEKTKSRAERKADDRKTIREEM